MTDVGCVEENSSVGNSGMREIGKNVKKVLAVEGKDECYFFDAFLRDLKITDYEIHVVGGKDRFKENLPALVEARGFLDNVEILAVIRDADKDANESWDSVCGILKKANLVPPPRRNEFSSDENKPVVGIFIMPGNSDTGMLEDLCLRSVKDNPAMECVEIFSKCVSKISKPPKNMAKAKAQAFLAAMPDIVNSVGLGAQKKYWDFESDEMADLRSFINKLK